MRQHHLAPLAVELIITFTHLHQTRFDKRLQRCSIKLNGVTRQHSARLLQGAQRLVALWCSTLHLGTHLARKCLSYKIYRSFALWNIWLEFILASRLRLDNRRQSHTHNLAHRADIVVGNPFPETHLQLREQRFVVQNFQDWLRYAFGRRCIVQSPDNSRIDRIFAELHRHSITHTHLNTLAYGKGVCRLRQRQYYVGKSTHLLYS